MIQVKNLVKRYEDFTAVDDISFEVAKGKILGFLGPNGAGKTTTMRILTGFMPATGGEVKIAGFDIFHQPMEARRRIGYLPEHPPLYPDMSVRKYLIYVAKLKGVPKKDVLGRVDKVAGQCGLTEVLDARIQVLSKGFKQRVGLAQALVNDPEVLVLDEPTIGLDPNQIREIRELIRSLAGNHTVILSTHILPEVTMTCDEAVIINRGKVIAADTIKNLTEKTSDENRIFLRLAEFDAETLPLLRATPNVEKVVKGNDRGTFVITGAPGADPAADLSMLALQHGWRLLELRHERPSLEEIFVRLTS